MLALNKTKAALQSCPCSDQKLKLNQNTRLIEGGQSFTWHNFAPADFIQDFGSMPRCCNSFLTIRFNQADKVASPSSFIATIMASSKAGSTRKAICLLPLGIFMFDMCLTLGVIFVVSVNVHHVSDTCKARSPAVLPALTGPLTKQLFEVTVMADQQHTQTHPKFTWRFLALNRHDIKAKPCRLSVEAATEREARRILAPHYILSLSARVPVLEVLHA
ncbi:host cell division inhibitor Icd-like protein [Kluyvera sp. M-M157-B]|uniref:host cell division inhibitor Icd-like protein n=1 Tax=Kluyvera TaxID=579 RepID=UPI003B22EAD3